MPARVGRSEMRLCGLWAISAGIWINSAPACDDWPQFLGPNRDGASHESGLVERLPETGPSVLWRRPVGQGFSGPVTAAESVYLFHLENGEERVERIDAADGKSRWSVGYRSDYAGGMFREPGPRATPVVKDGRIFTFG